MWAREREAWGAEKDPNLSHLAHLFSVVFGPSFLILLWLLIPLSPDPSSEKECSSLWLVVMGVWNLMLACGALLQVDVGLRGPGLRPGRDLPLTVVATLLCVCGNWAGGEAVGWTAPLRWAWFMGCIPMPFFLATVLWIHVRSRGRAGPISVSEFMTINSTVAAFASTLIISVAYGWAFSYLFFHYAVGSVLQSILPNIVFPVPIRFVAMLVMRTGRAVDRLTDPVDGVLVPDPSKDGSDSLPFLFTMSLLCEEIFKRFFFVGLTTRAGFVSFVFVAAVKGLMTPARMSDFMIGLRTRISLRWGRHRAVRLFLIMGGLYGPVEPNATRAYLVKYFFCEVVVKVNCWTCMMTSVSLLRHYNSAFFPYTLSTQGFRDFLFYSLIGFFVELLVVFLAGRWINRTFKMSVFWEPLRWLVQSKSLMWTLLILFTAQSCVFLNRNTYNFG